MSSPAFLIETEDLDGPTNMALDEILWIEAARGGPFVRLYEWADRPALSLGYFQSADDVRNDPRLRDLPLVRRLTGGGAIVHDREITYSLALPARLAPPTNWLYDRVHRSIAESLVARDLPATESRDAALQDASDRLCFLRADRFAVCVRGVKVLGSAQRRRPEAVLMHGSLILASSPAAPEVLGLCEILGSDCDVRSMRTSLRSAISAALDLALQPIELPADLRLRSAALADSKYRTAEWNCRPRSFLARNSNPSTQSDSARPVGRASQVGG
jgi:lipoate-protein ligase A